ncbi:MAG: hypothetical protein ACXWZS_00515 [Gemmatirosa sp.]
MSVNPNPEKGPRPPRGDHAVGERNDAESPERVASADARAHGAHGKGGGEEQLNDEQAVDTGDNRQLRTAGGGGDKAPDPKKFRENSEGRMGGPGWGNEQAGGSSVDRRPDQSNG